MPVTSPDLEVAQRARKRIAWRLLPFLFLLYVIAFLDRMNVGAAALQMPGDLGFNDRAVGLGAGMFFLGYLVLEIRGGLIAERWSARRWIARIMISWGIITALMAFIHTAREFYLVRFLVGAAEAGFFPAVIVYVSHWFRYQDRAKAIAVFYAANPLSYVIGSPLAGLLLGITWLGLRGWRWLFILEGIPAVVFAALPYLAGFVMQQLNGWHSDKSCERRWHAALPIFLSGWFLLLAVIFGSNLIVAVTLFTLVGASYFAFHPCFWAVPTAFLGESAAAASIGLINSVGNLGGFFGPMLMGRLVSRTHSFTSGLLYLVGSLCLSAILMLVVGVGRRALPQRSEVAAS